MVETYIFNTDLLDNQELFNAKFELMDSNRKRKILRLPKEKQKLSLGAGLMIKAFVGDVTSYNEYSKPLSLRTEFNLSHSGKYVVLSTAPEPVGVDIEMIQRGRKKVAPRFFTLEECIQIDQNYSPDTVFTKIWTLKESFLKCLGIGIGDNLNKFTVKIIDDKVKIEQNFNENFYYFKNYQVEGYQLSVCSEDNRFSETLVDVTTRILASDGKAVEKMSKDEQELI
jgi:4'-phosphopantetheinyl transferase